MQWLWCRRLVAVSQKRSSAQIKKKKTTTHVDLLNLTLRFMNGWLCEPWERAAVRKPRGCRFFKVSNDVRISRRVWIRFLPQHTTEKKANFWAQTQTQQSELQSTGVSEGGFARAWGGGRHRGNEKGVKAEMKSWCCRSACNYFKRLTWQIHQFISSRVGVFIHGCTR